METKLIAFTLVLGLSPTLIHAQAKAAAASSPNDVEQRIQAVASCLEPPVIVKGEPRSCTTLAQRMAELHIAGVSIAVVHNGTIEWARGFGVRQIGGDPVNADTLFQAGSISKPLAAMGALHLVQEKKLSLDSNINVSLTSWNSRPAPPRPEPLSPCASCSRTPPESPFMAFPDMRQALRFPASSRYSTARRRPIQIPSASTAFREKPGDIPVADTPSCSSW